MRRILRFKGYTIDISKVRNVECNTLAFDNGTVTVSERVAITVKAAIAKQFIELELDELNRDYPTFYQFREALKDGPYLDDNGFVYREKAGIVEMWHLSDL